MISKPITNSTKHINKCSCTNYTRIRKESQMVRIVNGYIIETTDSEDRQARYEHELEEADRDYEDRVFDEMEGM